jgi:hypothetical protein
MRNSVAIFLLLIFCTTYFFPSKAQEIVPVYSELEKNEIWTLNEDYSISYKVKKSILITDLKGKDHGFIVIPFNELSRIMHFEAQLVDPKNGKVIKKVSPKELTEYNTVSRGNLYEGSKFKVFGIESDKIPVKIEVNYEIRQSGNYYINSWLPIPDEFNQTLTSGKLEVIYPAELGLRYLPMNTEIHPDSGFVEGKVKLTWDSGSVAAYTKDTYEDYPRIKFAPKKFSLEGYSSDLSTWDGLGKWQVKLNQGKDELPEEFRDQILAMLKNKESDFEKIDTLYRFLQQNFRYVSVQLGIGGWMPKPAKEVLENKYGECKGLSNLMMAMLKVGGIQAQYTKVLAGVNEKDIMVDFPHNQFNHIILRIPLEKEVVWLECTSKTLPTGYLGDFTKDRHVLVITEEGGFIDKTPSYKDLNYNSYHFEHLFELKTGGDAIVSGVYEFEGNAAAKWLEISKVLDSNEKKNFLNSNLGGQGLVISEFLIEQYNRDFIPRARIKFQGQVSKYSQSTSKRIMLPLSWNKVSNEMMENGSVLVSEKLFISLYSNLEVEGNLPQLDVKEENFQFQVTSSFEDNNLSIEKSTLITSPQEFSKEDKGKLLQKINQLQNKSIVFKKPESNE